MMRLALLLLCLSSGLAAELSPKAKLEARLQGLRSFAADFSQVTRDDLTEEQSRGRCWLQKPLRFRWQLQEPVMQTLVSDGLTLWTHDPDLEQLLVQRLGDQLAGSPAALLTGQPGEMLQTFNVQLRLQEGRERFTLLPKADSSLISRLELVFAGEALYSILLLDQLGQTTRFRFRNPEVNPRLSADIFQLAVPAGTDVVRDF